MAGSISGYQILDVPTVAEQILSTGRPLPEEFRYANSILNQLDEPARAYVLMLRRDVDAMGVDTLQTITLNDGSAEPITIQDLVFIKAQNLNPGYPGDPKAPYLAEFSDKRWLLQNPNYSMAYTGSFNVPAKGWGGVYYDYSKNSGSNYTWDTMVSTIWTTMATQLGTYPSLPFSPDGLPESWHFPGVPAYQALVQVLRRIGCAIAWNPTATSAPYSIVRIGAADDSADRVLTVADESGRQLIHNREYIEPTRGRLPYGVKVLFHKIHTNYGSEETTPKDSSQWLQTAVYTVSVLATAAGGPSSGTESGIYHIIWDDLAATYDSTGSLTNSSNLNTRATERATDYYRMMDDGGSRLAKTYVGILEARTGSTIKGVAWRQDNQGGWITEVVRYPGWPLKVENGQWVEDGSAATQAPFFGPQYPVYPHLLQTVLCNTATADANSQYDARVERLTGTAPAAWTTAETVWLIQANGATLSNATKYLARLSGYSDRPVYVTDGAATGSVNVQAINQANPPVASATGPVIAADLIQFTKPLRVTDNGSGDVEVGLFYGQLVLYTDSVGPGSVIVSETYGGLLQPQTKLASQYLRFGDYLWVYGGQPGRIVGDDHTLTIGYGAVATPGASSTEAFFTIKQGNGLSGAGLATISFVDASATYRPVSVFMGSSPSFGIWSGAAGIYSVHCTAAGAAAMENLGGAVTGGGMELIMDEGGASPNNYTTLYVHGDTGRTAFGIRDTSGTYNGLTATWRGGTFKGGILTGAGSAGLTGTTP